MGDAAEAVKKYIFDSLSMKICDFHRICIHAARTHFVRTLAWIAVFLHRNEFGTKIDLILFRPFGRNFTRFFDTLKALRRPEGLNCARGKDHFFRARTSKATAAMKMIPLTMYW